MEWRSLTVSIEGHAMTRSTILFLLFAVSLYVLGQKHERVKESPATAQSKGTVSFEKGTLITALRIRSQPLVEILNYAHVRDLKPELGSRQQDLRLRLYAIPKEGDCMPDSHYVCSHHYYLAVRPYEEGLGEAVYDLGEVGEISQIQWLNPDSEMKARLRITVTNFPKEYFTSNKTLIKREKSYELEISVDKLSIRPVA